MVYKRVKYTLILLGIIIIINVGIYVLNIGLINQTLDQNSLVALDLIKKLHPVSYGELVSNPDLEEYYKLRDRFNIKLYTNYEKLPGGYGGGRAYRGSYFFFNWCVIKFIEKSTLKSYDFMTSSGTVTKVEHIALLTKKNGKWYLVKDTFTPGQGASYLDLLNINYTTKKIQKLKSAYEKL